MDALMRFPTAVKHDAAIDTWFNRQNHDLGALARPWFGKMRACGDDVRELMHDGFPTACVNDAAFGYVAVFRAHVNVGFYFGAALNDPAGLLEGTGKRMRHMKLRPERPTDSVALGALIDAAYLDMRWRLERGK
jgi:hypothetical protein